VSSKYPPQSSKRLSGLTSRTRNLAILKIPCEEHGTHTVTISGDDEVVSLVASFVQAELPFENIEVQEYRVSVYSPLSDYEGK
jgi:hypothetical protein